MTGHTVTMRRLKFVNRTAWLMLLPTILLGFSSSNADAGTISPTLSGSSVNTFGTNDDATTVEAFDCSPLADGERYAGDFDVTYTVQSNITQGPYHGSYTETGTVRVGSDHAGQDADYYITSLTASFKLTAGGTTISGNKKLHAMNDSATAACAPGMMRISADVDYTATIKTADGIKHDDHGMGNVFMTATPDSSAASNPAQYQSVFTSDSEKPAVSGQVFGEGSYGPKTYVKLDAKNGRKTVATSCLIRDSSLKTAMMLRCTDGAGYRRDGNSVVLTGNATANGRPTTYQIRLDADKPDGTVINIRTASGYVRNGRVDGGTIAIIK